MFNGAFSFPHPVLGLGDDLSGGFETRMEVVRDAASRSICFRNIDYRISNDYISGLVAKGFAQYAIKVYCSSTLRTWTFHDPDPQGGFCIDENELHGSAEIQVFVVASQNITAYNDASFNSNFAGHSFNVQAKEVLAIAGKLTLPIEKTDEKRGLGNIFAFFEQEEGKPMRFSFDQDKIHIYYPKQNVIPNAVFHTKPWTAYSIFIVPALTEAFRLLSDEDEMHRYESSEWFSVINTLLPREKWSAMEPFENAQLLLKDTLPVLRSLEELAGNEP